MTRRMRQVPLTALAGPHSGHLMKATTLWLDFLLTQKAKAGT